MFSIIGYKPVSVRLLVGVCRFIWTETGLRSCDRLMLDDPHIRTRFTNEDDDLRINDGAETINQSVEH